MIEWLIQSIDAHPDLERGIAPAGLLNQAERSRLDRLTVAKRRRDWLLGRWAAKHLLQSYAACRAGVFPPLDTLTLANDPAGVPFVAGEWGIGAQKGAVAELPDPHELKLSISHCDGHAFCALSDRPGLRIGADIERIERRDPVFVDDYFTDAERTQVASAAPADRDLLITLIWSAKEAALKALGLGLTVDTRRVACLIPAREYAGATWAALDIHCAPGLTDVPDGWLNGWWRRHGRYVLTLVSAPAQQNREP